MHRHDANAAAAQFREASFRDPVTLTRDLLRLEQHYRDEARRLQEEARDARERAQECRQWAASLQRTSAK